METNETFDDISRSLRNKESDCRSIVEKYLQTIQTKAHLNAFVEVYRDYALARAEEIDQKIFILEDLFNCKINFPHVNKSNHKHYKEYYNNFTKKIIEELFITDLETFGYEF